MFLCKNLLLFELDKLIFFSQRITSISGYFFSNSCSRLLKITFLFIEIFLFLLPNNKTSWWGQKKILNEIKNIRSFIYHISTTCPNDWRDLTMLPMSKDKKREENVYTQIRPHLQSFSANKKQNKKKSFPSFTKNKFRQLQEEQKKKKRIIFIFYLIRQILSLMGYMATHISTHSWFVFE